MSDPTMEQVRQQPWGYGVFLLRRCDELEARLEECEAECLEQARCNGKGSEREARLLARLEEVDREIKRLRGELRKPKGCTYDAEGRALTICHELATLRSEADRVHQEHAEMIDGYEATIVEYERRIEELQDAIDSRDKAAGFEDVPALSPEAQQVFRAAVLEIDGVNLRRVEELEARLAEASKLLDRWHTAYHEKDRDSLLECCDDDTSTFLYSTKRTDSSCDHVWVNASNFEPGPNEICLKCNALRAADSAEVAHE